LFMGTGFPFYVRPQVGFWFSSPHDVRKVACWRERIMEKPELVSKWFFKISLSVKRLT
jgi:hypothetical protein